MNAVECFNFSRGCSFSFRSNRDYARLYFLSSGRDYFSIGSDSIKMLAFSHVGFTIRLSNVYNRFPSDIGVLIKGPLVDLRLQ